MTTLEDRVAPARQAEFRQQAGALTALAQAKSAGTPAEVVRAEQAVVTAHAGFAIALAHRYRGRGLDRDDLRQLGLLGLVKAVKRFDPEVGAEFLSFAYPVILGEIKRHFRDQLTSIRMPRPLQDLRAETAVLREDFQRRTGRVAGDADLAASAGVSIEQIRAERTASFQCRVASLYQPEVYGAAVDNISAGAALDLRQVEDKMVMGHAMAQLTDRERQVVDLRYLQDLSQGQIGEAIGVSQMQVSRILRAIHYKLRASLADDPDQQLAS